MTERDYFGNENFDYDNNERLETVSELIRQDILRYDRVLNAEEEANEN